MFQKVFHDPKRHQYIIKQYLRFKEVDFFTTFFSDTELVHFILTANSHDLRFLGDILVFMFVNLTKDIFKVTVGFS